MDPRRAHLGHEAYRGTAALLEVDRATVCNKIKRYGLERPAGAEA